MVLTTINRFLNLVLKGEEYKLLIREYKDTDEIGWVRCRTLSFSIINSLY